MILVDANLLLYAYDSSSSQHKRARPWLENAFGGSENVRLALASILAFLRISTNRAVFRRPFRPEEAMRIAAGWLELPAVGIAEPMPGHWSLLETLARGGQARGPLLIDAHLAALAIEYGATLCTTDRDFARFAKLRIRNPLAD